MTKAITSNTKYTIYQLLGRCLPVRELQVNVSVHRAEHFEALHGTRHRKTAACKHKKKRHTEDFHLMWDNKISPSSLSAGGLWRNSPSTHYMTSRQGSSLVTSVCS